MTIMKAIRYSSIVVVSTSISFAFMPKLSAAFYPSNIIQQPKINSIYGLENVENPIHFTDKSLKTIIRSTLFKFNNPLFLGLRVLEPDKRKRPKVMPKIETIKGHDDYLRVISEDDDRLCIIKFRASWCKSCQKFDIKFKQLANEVADQVDTADSNKIVQEGKVRFADVEYGANKELCKMLNIKKLPYIHMYKGTKGQVDDFVCSPKRFQILLDKMQEHMDSEEVAFDQILDTGSKMISDHMSSTKSQEQVEQSEKNSKTEEAHQVKWGLPNLMNLWSEHNSI